MKIIRVFLMISITYMFSANSYAQEIWKNYSTDDGLPANEIRAIAEDTNGVKWFGTDGGGVAKLDGDTWTVYNEEDGLVYNKARKLAVDINGNLWVGTPRGVSSFDGKSWATYTTENSGLVSNYVISLAVDENNMKWFGTINSGVSIFDGQSWKTLTEKDGLAGNRVNAITFDADNNVWLGTDTGVSCYNGLSWKTYNTDNSGITNNRVFSIKSDESNTIWFGTRRGVSSFDGNVWTVYSAKTKYNILDTRCIYTIDIDSNGVLWFGSSIGMWSYDGSNWVSYTRYESELKDDVYVRALYTDIDGKKWIGARDALSARISDNKQIMKKSELPVQMKIIGNYPNPFNPETTIEFSIPESGHVTIDVYNVAGQKVRSLLSQNMPAGTNNLVWDGKNDLGSSVSTGVYFFRMQMGKTVLNHRMMLLR